MKWFGETKTTEGNLDKHTLIMIYVIMGMHKSGTSLIAETLHKSGINMGYFDEQLSYDEANHYERWHTSELNHYLLGTTPRTHSLDRFVAPDRKSVV